MYYKGRNMKLLFICSDSLHTHNHIQRHIKKNLHVMRRDGAVKATHRLFFCIKKERTDAALPGVRFGVRFEKKEKSMYPSDCKGFTLYPLEFQMFHGEMRRNGEKQGEVFNGFDSHRLHHSKP